MGETCLRRRPLGVGEDARLADGAHRRDRRGADHRGQGLRRAPHLFATNGTSTSNKVIFQTLLAPGEKLLLDRNCHKSVHHGVVLSGGHPIYLDSSINAKYSLYGPVPKKTILSAIRRHPDAQAIILTSCTYDGLRYDLAPIVEAAHAKGIKVNR